MKEDNGEPRGLLDIRLRRSDKRLRKRTVARKNEVSVQRLPIIDVIRASNPPRAGSPVLLWEISRKTFLPLAKYRNSSARQIV